MFVKVDLRQEPSPVSLEEPDDFGRFHVSVVSGLPASEAGSSEGAEAALREALDAAGVGSLDESGEDVHVALAALRRMVGASAGPGWEEGLSKMLDYAKSKGWADAAGETIQAHIVWEG